MKHLNRLLLITATMAALTSCKKDDDPVVTPSGPAPATENLHLINSATADGYTVEVYSKETTLYVEYNPMYVRLKDAGGAYVSGASLSWEPVMTMMMGGMEHTHSCPYSALTSVAGDPTLYEGYIVFIMASSGMDHWDLKVRFATHEVEVPLTVSDGESEFHKVYTSSVGTDGTTYLLAMLEPATPGTGVNDMVAGLFKRVNDDEFPVVDGYTIRVDSRMPGMGNHGAPGNTDLVQGSDGFYHGTVGFSMTGYWKINLQVEDASGQVVCGNEVSGAAEESSVHFKVNF